MDMYIRKTVETKVSYLVVYHSNLLQNKPSQGVALSKQNDLLSCVSFQFIAKQAQPRSGTVQTKRPT
jgi:hypothetical protein